MVKMKSSACASIAIQIQTRRKSDLAVYRFALREKTIQDITQCAISRADAFTEQILMEFSYGCSAKRQKMLDYLYVL